MAKHRELKLCEAVRLNELWKDTHMLGMRIVVGREGMRLVILRSNGRTIGNCSGSVAAPQQEPSAEQKA